MIPMITRSMMILTLGLWTGAAWSADAGAGAALADKWCAGCHLTGRPTSGPVTDGPPGFHAIASSGKTSEQLRTFLTKPHYPMPDLSLSRNDIDNLVAYIESLR